MSLLQGNAANLYTLPNLCSHCQHVFENWSDVIEDESHIKFSHCESIFALQLSASQGCFLCSQFLQNLASRGELEMARDSTIELFNKGLLPSRCWVRVISFSRILSARHVASAECKLLELRFYLDDLEIEEDGKDGEFSDDETVSEDDRSFKDEDFEDAGIRSLTDFVFKVILMPASTELLTQAISQKLPGNSKGTLSLAKAWYEGCCRSHPGCCSLQKYMPTRLLYVDGDRIQLCPSSILESCVKYATLSHCWGSLQSLKLTARNFHLLSKGLHVGILPKTFQDAIYISKELGLRYLWIDSLCIIQDDLEDWRRESRMMSNVYSSSSINIAATSAVDGNGGCFFDRDTKRSWRHRISVIFQGREVQYECVEDGISDSCLFQTPLANRAWAIQERLLAPRTLHCSLTQLFWECNYTTACEVFPQKSPNALKYGDFHLPRQPLTFGKDKLVAISGIARIIHDQDVADEYVAGLWRKGIVLQLCWKVQTQMPKVETPRAQSWSWASVDGIVDFPSSHEREILKYIDVLEVNIEPYDPFGEIPEGKITLSCTLLVQGTFDSMTTIFGSRVKLGSRMHKIRSALDCLGYRPELVYLLPVSKVSAENSKVRGLILEELEGSLSEYRRIGHFEYDDTHFDKWDSLDNQITYKDHNEVLKNKNIGRRRIITIK